MRTTLVLTLDDELAAFLYNRPGMVDPSAMVNRLVRQAMARHPEQAASGTVSDGVSVAMEAMLDEDTPAAG